jgi:voltage-gated potassium channel
MINKINDKIQQIKENKLNRELSRFFESMIIVLILSDIILLTLITFVNVSPQVYSVIVVFDLIVVLILIPDFSYRLWKADNKKEFLLYNFTDIIGMIPEIVLGHFGIYARYFRLIRIAALFKKDIKNSLEFLHRTRISYGIFVIVLILFAGAIVLFILEHGNNPQMGSMDDALWYLVVTITTVGYGDIYPQTTGGRIVGTIIMFVGIGFISFLTATITSIFIKDTEKEEMDKIDYTNKKIDQLQKEIMELKDLIKDKK